MEGRKKMIIDAHMHLGEDLMFNSNDNEEDILRYMDENNVGGCILQTGLITCDSKKANERIYQLSKKYPGKFWGILAISPYLNEEEYQNYVKWAVNDLGFVGLKLHTYAFCCPPTSPQAQKIYSAAEMFNLPVMVHTGNGIPAALPSLVLTPAKEHPNVKFILAHSGNTMYAQEALITAQECHNVYLETSWTTVMDKKKFVDQLGCERLMFGTDLPENCSVEIFKYKIIDLDEYQFNQIMYNTAKTVFNLK